MRFIGEFELKSRKDIIEAIEKLKKGLVPPLKQQQQLLVNEKHSKNYNKLVDEVILKMLKYDALDRISLQDVIDLLKQTVDERPNEYLFIQKLNNDEAVDKKIQKYLNISIAYKKLFQFLKSIEILK